MLAAGRARRMGRPKHRIPIDGVPMLVRVVRAVRACPGVSSVAVVLRADDEPGRRLLEPLAVAIAASEDPDEGRAASVRAGVRASPAEAGALLFCMADQPFLEASDYAALVELYEDGSAGLVQASYAGVRGSPLLFDRRYRDELLALRGADGGRVLLARHRADVRLVSLDPERGQDLDRPGDLPASR